MDKQSTIMETNVLCCPIFKTGNSGNTTCRLTTKNTLGSSGSPNHVFLTVETQLVIFFSAHLIDHRF